MSVKKIENLNKHENPETNTNPFNIQTYLNDNWDKVKDTVDNNADELTTAKQDITDIKSKNTEQDTNISNLNVKNTEQDADISNIKTKNDEQDTDINDIKTKNTNQDTEIEDIKTKNTSQDTEIEDIQEKNTEQDEEIANINKKDTAQDTNIETLTKRLTEKDNQIAELEDKVSDLNNNQIHGKASGEYVHLSDSAKMECSISPRGNSKQETSVQNENILDLTKQTITEKVRCTITDIKANEITISTQNSADLISYLRYKIKLNSGKWYFKKMFEVLEGTEGSTTGQFLIQKVKDWGVLLKIEKSQNGGTFTLTEDTELYVSMELKSSTDSFDSIKVRFYNMMFSKSDVDYVPFIPNSPSIDYPSEIEPVGDNKNLFDGELEAGGIDYQNGTFDSNTDRVRSKNFIKLDPNLHYTISRIDGSGKPFGIRGYDENKNYVGYIAATTSKIFTFIPQTPSNTDMPNPNTKFCYMKFIDLDNNLNARYKLEKGTVATPYSSYNCGSANVKVCNKNLFDTTKYSAEKSNGKYTLNDNKNGVLEMQGINGFYTGLYNVFKLLPNTEYTIKATVEKNTNARGAIFIKNNGKETFSVNDYDYEKELTKNGLTGELLLNFVTGENGNTTISFICNWTSNDAYIKYSNIQLIKGTYTADTIPDYIPHEEQNYTVDMQEEMLEGDYFDLENGKEVHNWGKAVFDKNSDVNCVHNNGTFQFKFCTLLENADNFSKTLCNIARHWENSWEENGCFISWEGYFCLLCKENEFGFNADMTADEAIVHLRELLVQTNIVVYYTYHSSGESKTISLELTKTQIEQLQALQKAKTYKNITNITTDTIAVLDVDYKRDLETYQKQQDDRITAIEQLLSTTTTSAMLLDNVQSDLESEVK